MAKNGNGGQNPKVGLISRIDYGSPGFRRAIVESCFEIFRNIEGTHFNILNTGVISRLFWDEAKKFAAEKLADKKNLKQKELAKVAKLPASKRRAALKSVLVERYLQEAAEELARFIPVLKMPDPEDPKKAKDVDLFIVTSAAFDGEYGETVAHFLADLRPDIRVWNEGGSRFLVKYVDKWIWALAPQKAVWMRGDYYSTAVERVIKDKIKQTTQSAPDLFIVGGFGSSINKPKGELSYQYISLPNASRIEETRVSENQIGVRVLEFPLDGGQYLTRTYSFKDLVANELSFISPPARANQTQKKIIEVMKARGWATPGMFKYDLDLPVSDIEKELQLLQKKKTHSRKGANWPGITALSGKKYYFDLEWIKRRLKYDLPNGPWNEDKIVAFGCFHGGSIETDYEFFLNALPGKIIKNGASLIIGAGDIIEGLGHNLDRKGEVLPGMNNNTIQEQFSAHNIGTLLEKVFIAKFSDLISTGEKEKIGLNGVIEKAFVPFQYILGNHDAWQAELGHLPLTVFHQTLVQFLTEQIEKHLSSLNLPLVSVRNIVNSRVIRSEFATLPSELKICIQHPFMSRAKTTSIRPQEMLDFAKRHGCQISIGANFHVSECVEDWDLTLGQCVSMEIGTIKHGSNFERRKMKLVDQGVGYLRVLSKNSRIFMTESAFYGGPRKPPVDNLNIVNEYILKEWGIPPIVNYNA